MITKNSTQDRSSLVQTNRDGRTRYTREQKERILDLFEHSGMSGKAFAEQHDIKYPTFALWRCQRREALEQREGSTAGGGFLLAEISTNPKPQLPQGLSLVLPRGAEVRASGESGVQMLASLISKLS